MCYLHKRLYRAWEVQDLAAKSLRQNPKEYPPCIEALKRLQAHGEICEICQMEMARDFGLTEPLIFENLSGTSLVSEEG